MILEWLFKKKTPKINHKTYYPAVKGYRKDCGIEFKSKMEANLYRFYKSSKGIIKVEYEPDKFTFPTGASLIGVTAYIPDLKLYFKKGFHYIEAKGVVDDYALEKARLLKKFYPHIKLYFVTPKEYREIQRLYAKSIKNWEY